MGAAAVQFGPQAISLATVLHTQLGVPVGKVATLFDQTFHLAVTPGGIIRALHRVARRAEPTYQALITAVQESSCVVPDETGWRENGAPRWLWVYTTSTTTVYRITPGRSFADATCVLPATYAGALTRDGWIAYREYTQAGHQSCLAHLIRRCRDVAAVATPAAARFPLRIQALLEEGLALRDRYRHDEISLHGLWTATGRLEVKLDHVLARTYHDAANRRLAKHLDHERPYLFTFLYCPGLDATNNAAERAIRALIGARKNWGGNRTQNGAHAQAVLTTLLQTAKQQGKNPFDVMVELLCRREPRTILDLVPSTRETRADSSPGPPLVVVPDRFHAPSLVDLAASA